MVFGSVLVYSQKDKLSVTTWCPEVFGFVWGIVLANFKTSFLVWAKEKWWNLCIVSCLTAGLLGVLYLKYKPVVFMGDYVLKIALGLAIILFMLFINIRISVGNRISLFLGKISYEVYLLHGIVFSLISFLMPEINSGWFVLVSIVATVILSWIVNKFSSSVIKRL